MRHQLVVLQRQIKRPRIFNSDRTLWILLHNLWREWKTCLVIVKPETVIRWHRQGFRLYWSWKSRSRNLGRPGVDPEIRALIRRMSQANPLWGAPRIHGELLKLGVNVSQSTVARKPPSQTWPTFLANHLSQMVSVDFFVVPTVTFQVLFVFVMLAHERRQVLHFNVTAHPSAEWAAQQMIEAFPDDNAARFLLRDRDQIYGNAFRQRVQGMGIEEVLTAPQSPWQNPFAERLVGSIRRECLDHVIVFNEISLRHTLRSDFDYYQRSRTHLALAKDAPQPRPVQLPENGDVVELPHLWGLHHRYERRAA